MEVTIRTLGIAEGCSDGQRNSVGVCGDKETTLLE